MKISHRDQFIIDDMATLINNTFTTKNKLLSVTRGYIHNYMSIGIDFTRKDCVTLTIYDYLEDIMKEVDKCGDMNSIAVIPTSDNLFTIDESLKLLNDKYQTTSAE